MKTYNEMADNVFLRRDQYKNRQKSRRKIITKVALSFSCAAAALVVGVGIWQSGYTPNQQSSEPSGGGGEENLIFINQIDDLPENSVEGIALFRNDFIRMTREELNKYYGINVFPEVPEDLKKWEQVYGIYRRDDGKGELYWDRNDITYVNDDISRAIKISVETAGVPANHPVFYDKIPEKSVINGISVAIAKTKRGNLYGEFTYENTCFYIFAEGLSDEEFVTAIRSLIK